MHLHFGHRKFPPRVIQTSEQAFFTSTKASSCFVFSQNRYSAGSFKLYRIPEQPAVSPAKNNQTCRLNWGQKFFLKNACVCIANFISGKSLIHSFILPEGFTCFTRLSTRLLLFVSCKRVNKPWRPKRPFSCNVSRFHGLRSIWTIHRQAVSWPVVIDSLVIPWQLKQIKGRYLVHLLSIRGPKKF